MAVAHQELGERALACIGVSPSYPTREMRDAITLAEQLGVPYRLIDTEEHLDPNYAANLADRCYFCKTELHDKLQAIAQAEGWASVADGNNASDLGDYRPGMTAAREHGVRSPLVEAGISKAEVRALAQALELPVWDKPASPCLSSRVPHGTPITTELLRQIEGAEDALVALGFRQFRIRHHGEPRTCPKHWPNARPSSPACRPPATASSPSTWPASAPAPSTAPTGTRRRYRC